MLSMMASHTDAATLRLEESKEASCRCRPEKAQASFRQSDETDRQAQQRLSHMPWAEVSTSSSKKDIRRPADQVLESSATRKSPLVCDAVGVTYNVKDMMTPSS